MGAPAGVTHTTRPSPRDSRPFLPLTLAEDLSPPPQLSPVARGAWPPNPHKYRGPLGWPSLWVRKELPRGRPQRHPLPPARPGQHLPRPGCWDRGRAGQEWEQGPGGRHCDITHCPAGPPTPSQGPLAPAWARPPCGLTPSPQRSLQRGRHPGKAAASKMPTARGQGQRDRALVGPPVTQGPTRPRPALAPGRRGAGPWPVGTYFRCDLLRQHEGKAARLEASGRPQATCGDRPGPAFRGCLSRGRGMANTGQDPRRPAAHLLTAAGAREGLGGPAGIPELLSPNSRATRVKVSQAHRCPGAAKGAPSPAPALPEPRRAGLVPHTARATSTKPGSSAKATGSSAMLSKQSALGVGLLPPAPAAGTGLSIDTSVHLSPPWSPGGSRPLCREAMVLLCRQGGTHSLPQSPAGRHGGTHSPAPARQ